MSGCLLEGRAEPVVDGEQEAGWGWDTLGLGGALPCCQNIPTGEPRLLSAEAQVTLVLYLLVPPERPVTGWHCN